MQCNVLLTWLSDLFQWPEYLYTLYELQFLTWEVIKEQELNQMMYLIRYTPIIQIIDTFFEMYEVRTFFLTVRYTVIATGLKVIARGSLRLRWEPILSSYSIFNKSTIVPWIIRLQYFDTANESHNTKYSFRKHVYYFFSYTLRNTIFEVFEKTSRFVYKH